VEYPQIIATWGGLTSSTRPSDFNHAFSHNDNVCTTVRTARFARDSVFPVWYSGVLIYHRNWVTAQLMLNQIAMRKCLNAVGPPPKISDAARLAGIAVEPDSRFGLCFLWPPAHAAEKCGGNHDLAQVNGLSRNWRPLPAQGRWGRRCVGRNAASSGGGQSAGTL